MTDNKRTIVVADPPHEYKVWSKKGEGRTAQSHYQTMTMKELADLGSLMDQAFGENSLLFLWTSPPQMEYSYKLMRAWDYEPKTVAFTWIKTTKSYVTTFRKAVATAEWLPFMDDEVVSTLNKMLFTGMGHYTRANPEFIIVGRRGTQKLERVRRNIHSVIFAPQTEHSQKPDEANKRIELLARRPQDTCYELFARRQYRDWTCTGLELDGLDIRDALQNIAKEKTHE